MNDHLRHEPFLSPPQGLVLAPQGLSASAAAMPEGIGPPAWPAGSATPAAMLARIKQLESQNRRLRRLSITDELTCAFNRRHFSASFAALVHLPPSPLPRTTALALCLFDIDHFKAYNDAFGHPMGDAALRAVSVALGALLRRESDRLFRFGGDEFGALYHAATPGQAEEFAQQLQAAINGLQISHPRAPGSKLSATFGVAWHPDPVRHALNPKQLYSAADNTLYAAKQGGRNRILMRIMCDPDPADLPARAAGALSA